MVKPNMRDLMKEEGMLDIIKDVPGAPQTSHEAPEVKKVAAGRGRPKTKPESKLTSFHLSLELIAKIDEEATKTMMGNKSALASKIFEEYFAKEIKTS